MKRFIALLIALMLMGTACVAEGIDLTAMSTDELIDLQKQITAEINARTAETGIDIFYPGTYVVGKDIAAGSYIFTATSEEGYSVLYWYASEEDYDSWDSIDSSYLSKDEQVYISLTDEMVIQLSYNACNIQQGNSFLFAP